MKTKFLDWFAIILILETGLIHIMMAQHEYEMAPYVGYLFAASFFGSLAAALGIYHRQFWGWALGFVVSAGAIAAYIWSRTMGLPAMEMEMGEWFTPYAVVSKSVEGIFVLLVLLRPWKIPAVALLPFPISKLRYILPIAAMLVVGSVSAFTYQWNVAETQEFGQHVGSLKQVSQMPVVSSAELEERYGVQVSLVANSMMDSIVDVRLKVIDPDKARLLFKNQTALLVGQQFLVFAPHQHRHGTLKRDKIHFIFFSTQNETIHVGSEVSLVFGPVRLESVIVK